MIGVLTRKYRNLISDKKFSEILTGSAFALASRIAATILTLLANIIIARVYGAKALGVLALVNSFLVLVTIFTVLGTGTSILRLIPEHISKYSTASAFRVYRKTEYLVLAVSIVTGTVFFLASGVIADKVFSKPHLSFLFALAAGFVVFKSLMDLNTQAVRGLRLIRTFAVMQVIPALAMLVVLVAWTLVYRQPDNPVYAQLAAFGITAVIGAVIMQRAFKSRMRAGDTVQTMSVLDILTISTPMLMTASMQFFVAQTGVIMLGMFRSESEVGYYSAAVRLATLTAFILQAINTNAAPRFSELYHTGKIDELFHVAKKSTKLVFWTTAPILIVLITLGGPILSLLFGRDFTIAYPALVLLVIGRFAASISGSTAYFMNMTGHQKALSKIILVAALANVGLNLVLIPHWGIMGAAVATMISGTLWNVYTLVYIKNKFGRTLGYLPMVKSVFFHS